MTYLNNAPDTENGAAQGAFWSANLGIEGLHFFTFLNKPKMGPLKITQIMLIRFLGTFCGVASMYRWLENLEYRWCVFKTHKMSINRTMVDIALYFRFNGIRAYTRIKHIWYCLIYSDSLRLLYSWVRSKGWCNPRKSYNDFGVLCSSYLCASNEDEPCVLVCLRNQ